MKKLSLQFASSILATLFLAILCVSCSSDDDTPEAPQQLTVSQLVGCWKIPVSDTVTEYWQFSTAVENNPETQSRLVSIDTPSGTYIITRVTENPQNHTRVMELLAKGAYLLNTLTHEILMSEKGLSYYSTSFKVTIINNQLTLDSDTPSKSRVLVNVHRNDTNDETDYAQSLPSGTYLSFGGYEIYVNGEYCTFTKHPLYKGFESILEGHWEGTWTKNLGKIVDYKKTGKNSAVLTIVTSESIESIEPIYFFDPVEIEVNLQFWGKGYGIIKGGRTIRNGKHYIGIDAEYIENEITPFGTGIFG